MQFLDTNILVYAALNQDPTKHRLAALIVKDAIANNEGAISAQVVNEFVNSRCELFSMFRKKPPQEKGRIIGHGRSARPTSTTIGHPSLAK